MKESFHAGSPGRKRPIFIDLARCSRSGADRLARCLMFCGKVGVIKRKIYEWLWAPARAASCAFECALSSARMEVTNAQERSHAANGTHPPLYRIASAIALPLGGDYDCRGRQRRAWYAPAWRKHALGSIKAQTSPPSLKRRQLISLNARCFKSPCYRHDLCWDHGCAGPAERSVVARAAACVTDRPARTNGIPRSKRRHQE